MANVRPEGCRVEKIKVITNTGTHLMLVCTEPEGQDYWLRPGESLELRADIASGDEDFEISTHDQGLTAYPTTDMGYISAWSDGKELPCGHQRPIGFGNRVAN